jgi:hypothetical protein
LLLGISPSATRAQSSNSSDQQTQPAQEAPSAQHQLSANWNLAVRSLAEKIACAAAPSHEVSLELKNISSLSSADTAAILQALKNQLRDRRLRLTPPSTAAVHVDVTLSDGAEGRITVTAIRRGADQQIMILPAPDDLAITEEKHRESLTLTARLVREQQETILDFALFNDMPNLESRLLVVEPDRLAFYRSADFKWELLRTIRIPHSKQTVRDMRANVDIDKNVILLTEGDCSGYLTEPEIVHCSSGRVHSWIYPYIELPGHEGSEFIPLSEKCDGGLIVLASGTGDWTQPDSIQGFEYVQKGTPAVPAGNMLNFEGPIMSLLPDGEGVIARVVVHNLKTENYEAYLVTATCSH